MPRKTEYKYNMKKSLKWYSFFAKELRLILVFRVSLLGVNKQWINSVIFSINKINQKQECIKTNCDAWNFCRLYFLTYNIQYSQHIKIKEAPQSWRSPLYSDSRDSVSTSPPPLRPRLDSATAIRNKMRWAAAENTEIDPLWSSQQWSSLSSPFVVCSRSLALSLSPSRSPLLWG